MDRQIPISEADSRLSVCEKELLDQARCRPIGMMTRRYDGRGIYFAAVMSMIPPVNSPDPKLPHLLVIWTGLN